MWIIQTMKVNKVTKHAPWVLHKTISATLSALGVTERTAAHVPSDAYTIAEAMNFVEFRVSSNDNTTPLTGTMHVYAARKGDDICHVGSVALTTGDQVATSGLYYIDTMVMTSKWISEVHIADGSGNDGMSRLMFDATGYDTVFVRITFTGSSKVWRVDISGF